MKGIHNILWDFPGDSVVRNLPDNAGDTSLIPGAGRSAGEGWGPALDIQLKMQDLRTEGYYSPVFIKFAAVHHQLLEFTQTHVHQVGDAF